MSGFSEDSHTGRIARGSGETETAGRQLAGLVEPGDLILVTGEVGAGKSTLIRAAMRELGVEGAIPSPTFTIGRLYQGQGQRFAIAHLDLYRLGEIAREDPGLIGDYLGPGRVAFVEWPGGAVASLEEMATRTGRVAIDHIDRESRRITIDPPA